MDFGNSIEKTLSEIQKVMNTNSIVGTPIKTKDKVIIPISKTAIGFGVGVSTKDKNEVNLAGAGGGGSIDPVAFVVIHNDVPGSNGVEIIRVDQMGTPIESLLAGVADTVFGFIENSKVKPATEESSEKTIENIKTKIKPKKES